eukprot:gb/GEZJ01000346.1/.p3 GENE.gb/GEZJ01000346.1/~~gb/GEZJ01000346.1/.p3  ORF type:complete len:479 (-),score=78.00 gb/GEZJ01000346.1/:7779-9215(-)
MAVPITFRTLTGATFQLAAEPTDTILDIKRRVADSEHVSDFASYRLIFRGRILSDDATITSAGISSTGFVVVMPPKKKSATPAATSTPAPISAPARTPARTHTSAPNPTPTSAPTPTPTFVPTPAPTSTPSQKSTPPSAAESTPAQKLQSTPAEAQAATPSSAPSGPSSLVVGQQYEQTVRRICEVGFAEDEVKKALRAAFNNPDRAVDYLINGIPESALPPAPPAPPAATNSGATAPTQVAATAPTQVEATDEATLNQPSTTAPDQQDSAHSAAAATPFNMFEAAADTPSAGGGTGTASLDFLRSVPQFNFMRRLIQSNPAVLPQLLQQLENINPSLMALIEDNQEEFTRLINEPIPEGEDSGDAAMEQLAQAMANSGGGADSPGPGQILITEEEHEQLHRLNELASGFGLEQAQVVETWLACDRNENLAANYLVENAEQLRADQAANAAASAAAEQDSSGQNQSDRPDSGNQGPPS